MARKTDDFMETFGDYQRQDDIMEITDYLEDANYKLEDLEYILYGILLEHMERKDLFIENKLIKKKRYLN